MLYSLVLLSVCVCVCVCVCACVCMLMVVVACAMCSQRTDGPPRTADSKSSYARVLQAKTLR